MMDFRWIEWNREKIARHGVSEPEVEYVVEYAKPPFPQGREEQKYLVWGPTASGRLLQVVYLIDPDDTVLVIHARPLTEVEKRRWRRLQRRRGRP